MLAIEFFERGARRFPDRVVVADDTMSVTYGEMLSLAHRTARALMAAGVRPDDPVAILSPNHPAVLQCQYGIVRAGALWTPCNFRNTAADNGRQLAAYEAKWIFFHSTLAAQIAVIREMVPTLKGAVCIDRAMPDAPYLGDWIAPESDTTLFPVRTMSDGVALLSTSGTTGLPKGALQTNRAFEALVASYGMQLQFDGPPVHLVVAPLTHAAGVTHWAFLSRGCTNVLLPSADPGLVLSAIEKHRASFLFLPPTVIYMLLAHPDLKKHDYSSLRYFLYGAAPMSVTKLKEAMEAFGPVMTQNYGQTEALMMITIMTRDEHSEILANPALAHRIASAGREGPFARVEIMGDDGRFLPPGERGEIVFQSSLLMDGYYRNPQATAEVSAGGWHHSADVGYKDEDGFVYIVDRKRDMIISGGFNVFPNEVEQVALSHPAVQDCVIVGVPDEKWGESVLAAVQVKSGVVFDADDFIAFCKRELGSVKAPKRVEIWETLPRSTVGKTLRRVVREKYWEGRDRKI
jgi:acyl-CoA synthetase (AMP-forming)/AMP-acid ligase II